nr:hypothetical protein Iba_chr12eCG7720 [Ipomoea batatas]
MRATTATPLVVLAWQRKEKVMLSPPPVSRSILAAGNTHAKIQQALGGDLGDDVALCILIPLVAAVDDCVAGSPRLDEDDNRSWAGSRSMMVSPGSMCSDKAAMFYLGFASLPRFVSATQLSLSPGPTVRMAGSQSYRRGLRLSSTGSADWFFKMKRCVSSQSGN